MIRWRYILSRLVIVGLVLMLIRWGLGPVATYVTVQGLQESTGAKVEIESSEVGFFPPRIQYHDVRVADPRGDKELKDAFRADKIDLVIDGKALLHRRWVATDGRITGIQIGSDRETSGHLAETFDQSSNAPESIGMLDRFLSGATDQLGDHANSVIGGLETVQRSKEIRTRWEQDYEALMVRARELESRIREIRDMARGIDNPLRDWEALDRTLARGNEAMNKLQVVRESIDALPERAKTDMVSMQRAKQIDLEKIDQYVPGSLSQSDNFGVDLMAEAVRQQVQKVRGYLDSGRNLAEYTMVAPETLRDRGIDHDLLGLNRRPEIMIRRCEVGGMMTTNGNAYVMTGILENLSSEPSVMTEPTTARLRLDGPDIVRVEMTSDRRQGADVDLVTLHWPQVDAKPMHLGNRRDAGISIMGGQRELWVQLRSAGDQVSGRFVSKHAGVKMSLNVDSKYAQSPAAVALGQSLASVDTLEVDANFNGTWRDMQLQLNSNLGPIFKNAARDAVASQVQASKRQLAVKVEEAHLRETESLRRWLEEHESEAQTLLASATASIKEMREKVISNVGHDDHYLGKPEEYIGKLRSAIEGRLR